MIRWIKRIIGFIKLYKDYEYEPETCRSIIEFYKAEKHWEEFK